MSKTKAFLVGIYSNAFRKLSKFS